MLRVTRYELRVLNCRISDTQPDTRNPTRVTRNPKPATRNP